MECRYCKNDCIKSGKYLNHHQRFFCTICRKYQKSVYLYKGCEQGISAQIAILITESCGIRSISRILKISTGKVIRSIKKIFQERRKVKRTKLFGREFELDEMRTYIGNKKKKYWIVYAIDRATKEVVDFKVGKRNNKTLQKVIDTLLLSKAKKIYTDNLRNYKYLIPEEIHKTGKHQINHIERKNLSVRTHLKRLSRKTICFSKSISMLEASLGIYFWRESIFS